MKKIILLTFLTFVFAGYLCGYLNRQTQVVRIPASLKSNTESITKTTVKRPILNDKKLAQAMQKVMKTQEEPSKLTPLELIQDLQSDELSPDILAQLRRPEMQDKLRQQLGRRQGMSLRMKLRLFSLCEKMAIDEGSTTMMAHDDMRQSLQDNKALEALGLFRYIMQNSQDNELIRESGQEFFSSSIDKNLREIALTYVNTFKPHLSAELAELAALANLNEP